MNWLCDPSNTENDERIFKCLDELKPRRDLIEKKAANLHNLHSRNRNICHFFLEKLHYRFIDCLNSLWLKQSINRLIAASTWEGDDWISEGEEAYNGYLLGLISQMGNFMTHIQKGNNVRTKMSKRMTKILHRHQTCIQISLSVLSSSCRAKN